MLVALGMKKWPVYIGQRLNIWYLFRRDGDWVFSVPTLYVASCESRISCCKVKREMIKENYRQIISRGGGGGK